MIAIGIVGGVCVLAGLLFCLPVYIRLAKCKVYGLDKTLRE